MSVTCNIFIVSGQGISQSALWATTVYFHYEEFASPVTMLSVRMIWDWQSRGQLSHQNRTEFTWPLKLCIYM